MARLCAVLLQVGSCCAGIAVLPLVKAVAALGRLLAEIAGAWPPLVLQWVAGQGALQLCLQAWCAAAVALAAGCGLQKGRGLQI